MTAISITATTSSDGGHVIAETEHRRSISAMRALGKWADVHPDVCDAAIDNIRNGTVTGLLVSGPQASGKDTLCPGVLDAVGVEGVHARVAHGIRADMAAILAVMSESTSVLDAVANISGQFDVSNESAAMYVDMFYASVRTDATSVDVHERTERMRRALQWHGNEAKSHRSGYWVRKTYQSVIPLMAEGKSVYLTDGRFAGEVDAGRAFGIYCVRLFVPEEVRIARILTRDGFVPSLDTLRHPGETGLDGYWGFDLEIDNSSNYPKVLATVAHGFEQHRNRLVSLT